MRKCLVLFAVCIYSISSDAQNVGVGVAIPQNKLHVGGGFRLDTLTGIGGAGLVRHDANGVVYGIKFSGNISDVLRGDGTFGSGGAGSVGWLLNGNSGTNPSTHFLGTTDNIPLRFRTNNLPSGLIDPITGNTTWGYQTLSSNTTGHSNVAIGDRAMISNTEGFFNTAVGLQTLFFNTTGYNNSAFGMNTLVSNRSGYFNTGLGSRALNANTNGHDNTAVGYAAMQSNETASFNTAVGAFSLYNNSGVNGVRNSAVGYKSLQNNQQGGENVATGYESMASNITGWGNTASGYHSLVSNNASYHAAYGYRALFSNTTGFGNTAIGYNAGALLPGNVSNVTCIGGATGWNTTSSNQVNIGNFSVTWIGGQTGWFHYSDKRIKNNIKDDVPGLAFITRLKPVSYHVDVRKQEEIANNGKKPDSELNKAAQKDWEGKYDVEKIKMTGFFAQDVEEAAKAINYSFSGVHNPKNGGLYSLDYSKFVVPLVKAVQEQQIIIEKQQKQIDDLIKRIEALEKK